MTLQVISSSSKGNAYALQSDTETLFIEAGVRLSTVKKSLRYDLRTPVGCICSHSHGDHFKYAEDFARLCPIYAPEEAIAKVKGSMSAHPVKEGTTFKLGSFRITPFEVYHDVPCFGYLVYHKDMGVLLFATDTFTMPSVITGCTTYMIEANYSDQLLTDNVRKGELSPAQQKRIYTSHMSIGNTLQYLRDCHAENARQVVLIHLSSRNSSPADFERQTAAEFGCPVYIAKKNLSIPL